MTEIKREYNFQEGELLLIDKPFGWTSFDVVNKMRWGISRKTGIKKIKVGHAGTLDPLATGLLIICTGKFTKKIDELQHLDKEYTGSFFLGATTPSFDKETEVDATYPVNHINEGLLMEKTKLFIGDIEQIPPIYSAIKIDGVRAYKHARKNEEKEISPRQINISAFEINNLRLPVVDFTVSCGKGTYIRSLARDFGKEIRSGAYLTKLCRTRIGKYHLKDAITIETFEKNLNES